MITTANKSKARKKLRIPCFLFIYVAKNRFFTVRWMTDSDEKWYNVNRQNDKTPEGGFS
jgi:hypothetical protein